MPLISVIVTTFNREVLLKETIQSILAQSVSDFELIVVDNFSDYPFKNLMDSFEDSRIKFVQNYNDGIIAVNRNVGIRQSKGKYIAFCDDDDLWEPNKLEEQIGILESNKADLVYTGTLLFNEDALHQVHCYKPVKTLAQFFGYNPVTLSSVVLRNTQDFLFDENKNFGGIEDYTLWIHLWMKGFKFHMIEKPLVKFRVSATSFSSLSRSNNEYKIILFKWTLFKKELRWNERLALIYFFWYSLVRFSVLKFLNR